MSSALEFTALLKSVVLPPTGLLLVALIGLTVLPRRHRLGRLLAIAAIAGLLVLAMPIVARALLVTVAPLPFAIDEARAAGAIVVLGGGSRREAPDYGSDTLSALTLERVRYGARLARATSLPVMVSGGAPSGGLAEALLMREVLEEEFGTPVRWVEATSNNTRENAMNSATILRSAGIRKVILVTHGFDALRAREEFSAAGIESVAGATGLPSRKGPELLDWIPSIAGLQLSYYVCYEIAGNAARIFLFASRHE